MVKELDERGSFVQLRQCHATFTTSTRRCCRWLLKTYAATFILFCSLPLFGQSNSGELRLKVTDPTGSRVRTSVQIVSEANQYRNTLVTNDQGRLDVQRLPYGVYQIEVVQSGFAKYSRRFRSGAVCVGQEYFRR